MAFGIAGAAAGGTRALEEIVAQRIMQQKLEQEVQERQRRFELDQQRANETMRENDYNRKRTDRIDAENTADRAKVDAREATERNGRSDMAAVLAMPGMTDEAKRSEIMGSGLRTGSVSPSSVMDAIKPTPVRLRAVTTPGPGGRPINRMVPETEAVEEYREPKSPPAPENPQYIQVIGTDGRLQMLTPDEIRSQGGVATTKGNAPDPVKAAEVRDKILTTAKALRDSSGRTNMTGNRLFNPDYNLGWSDEPRPGSKAANAKSLYDTLKSNLTLENLSLLKGAMSDKDLLFLQSAGTSLNSNMDDPTFEAELNRIIERFEPTVGASAPPGGGSPAGVSLIWDGTKFVKPGGM